MNTKLYFYSSSADKYPGKGTNEYLAEYPKNYSELAKIPDWRKVLSNFPMTINQLQWSTVEHYYQASKFKVNNPEFYKQFSMCGSSFSLEPNKAKSAGGKSGGIYRPKNIVIDSDFFTSDRQNSCMYEALYTKFYQEGLPKKVLLATGNAELCIQVEGFQIKDNLF